ncbi:glycoside hydrolase family 3 C-terminal domain-containing protein [Cellulomonas endometrii]|uniref:glycoside hydrolase family 3 C-terminal domain-containing protein n=1 Tax=Cellulomonas endometrii TaxID=3036301 RepID=UPI0024AD2BAB|nr:glycoside hydrolase family 3 C-terminal domain-containing protein [Cellulomonas endometrii]
MTQHLTTAAPTGTEQEPDAFSRAVAAVRGGASAQEQAENLYDRLTDDERLGLLDGDQPFWEGMHEMTTVGYNTRPIVHGAVDRLGIPGLRFSDGPRGVVMGRSTAFPVSMARGATWDTDLEERIGRAIGEEVRAQGGNFFAGVCINLPRHPAWGRIQETYGEDPVLLGELGAALTRGVRTHVMACAKHYALNSMENARFQVDVTADDATLHEVYLPHFRRVVEEGVDGIMTSYNSVNGEWAGQNADLMNGVLRDRWGFPGVTVSDFILGLRDAALSLEAGLDVEEPFAQQRAQHLRGDLEAGRASWDSVRRSGVRSIATQLRFSAAVDTPAPPADVVASAAHRALAREAAARSMVLLHNAPVDGTPVLPLDPSVRRLAVIGRLADVANTGDHGSSDVRAPEVVTALAGLRAALPATEIVVVPEDDPEAAAAAAATCDAAVVVAGYTAADEGEYTDPGAMAGPQVQHLFPPLPEGDEPAEAPGVVVAGGESVGFGGDRARLTLRPVDELIIRAVAAAQPRTVVTVVAAGAVLAESWRHDVPAVVMAWYSGMEGGHALADVLLGRVDPSGRLPFSVPTTEDHLPFFDRDATAIRYDRWHGQRLLDRLDVEPAYPLGFGLSYTTFTLADAVAARTDDETAEVTVTVANTGTRDGRHVVQVYGAVAGDGHEPERHLLGFAPVDVAAGSSARVTVLVSLRPLTRWDPSTEELRLPTGVAEMVAAAHARDPQGVAASLPLD